MKWDYEDIREFLKDKPEYARLTESLMEYKLKLRKQQEYISALVNIESPDCGDNSCMFAEKKTGMRTNGGCRCLRGPEGIKYASQLHAARLALKEKQ